MKSSDEGGELYGGGGAMEFAKNYTGLSPPVIVALATIVIGGIVLLIGRAFRRSEEEPATQIDCRIAPESTAVDNHGSNQLAGGNLGKRAKNKKRREVQPEFIHPWLVNTLKGHTANILDMNFSGNDKFLASCAEDCGLPYVEDSTEPRKQPREATTKKSPTSSSPTSSSSSSSSSSNNVTWKKCTRRQRNKNQQQQLQSRSQPDSPQPAVNRLSAKCKSQSTSSNARNGQARSHRQVESKAGDPRHQTLDEAIKSGCDESRGGHGVPPHQAQIDEPATRNKCVREQLSYISDEGIRHIMGAYVLPEDLLESYGYPVMCNGGGGGEERGGGVYFRQDFYHERRVSSNYQSYTNQLRNLDANAREFVPTTGGSGSGNKSAMVETDTDSGNYSGSSRDSSDLEQDGSSDCDKNSDIVESSSHGSATVIKSNISYADKCRRNSNASQANDYCQEPEVLLLEERCSRCQQFFQVTASTGDYVSHESCCYHPGKFRKYEMSLPNAWSCCHKKMFAAKGCTSAPCHVWSGVRAGLNGPLRDYTSTRSYDSPTPRHPCQLIYALDSEMCFTKRGLELAKVTVVNVYGEVVYNTLVKPDVEVIDHNTRFSGIKPGDLNGVTKTRQEVNAELRELIYEDTLLVGHGLENDLRALKLCHRRVVDTAFLFPHHRGMPFRNNLQAIAKSVLGVDIQQDTHDSLEDARVVMDITLRRIQMDLYESLQVNLLPTSRHM